MLCECGCGWEGEDEVTQWLLEEAAFAALEVSEAMERSGEMAERREAARLRARHDELRQMKERMLA